MKKVFIMSAKFNMAHCSHMLAYYRMFEALGCEPYLYLNTGYREFESDFAEYRKIYIQKNKIYNADILYIYNLSIHDNIIINKFKRQNGAIKIYFLYHEPWQGIRQFFTDAIKRKESVKELVKRTGRYIFGVGVLKKSCCVILSSAKGMEYYSKYCLKYNKNYKYFPLIFNDEAAGTNQLSAKKKYFSFIATANLAKNFPMFIKYIKHYAHINTSALFQIVTSSNIEKYIDNDLKELKKQGRLIVNSGHPLSIDEINRAYAVSRCTWLLYNSSTQSGVLCKAFMWGSPVIAGNLGSFREYIDGNNGIIVENSQSFEDIERAYQKICDNIEMFSENARKTFINKFYWENKKTEFMKIIG